MSWELPVLPNLYGPTLTVWYRGASEMSLLSVASMYVLSVALSVC